MLVCDPLELLCVLEQKVGPLNEVDLSIGFLEIVANRQNIVHDDQPDLFVLYAARQVEEHLVVVVQILRQLKLNPCQQGAVVDD